MLSEEGISAENSGGIVIRGKVDPNAIKFSIKLWNKGGDGFFKSILELEVGIGTQGFKIFNGVCFFFNSFLIKIKLFKSKSDKGEDLPAKPAYNNDSPYEALIQFKVDTFDIWMNNTPIYQYPAGDLSVVNVVQVHR